jgi:hypothetical protein
MLQQAVACFVLVCVTLLPASAAAEPWQSRFLDECLTPGPTQFTPEFDAYHVDSYSVNKLELVETLPRAARGRGLRLRALLIVGPLGSLWSYSVFTFLVERGGIRINALAMPHARITEKSTALLTPHQFSLLSEHLRQLSFVRAVRDPGALQAELSKQRSELAEPELEWQYKLLFTEFEPEQSPLLFGDFNGLFGGTEQEELSAVLRRLTDGLKPTYEHGLRYPGAVRHRPWMVSAGPLFVFQHDPLPALNRGLAERGYAGFDADAHWFGLGVEASWRRLRFSYDLALSTPRVARHASGARAHFSRRRIAVRVGYDVLAQPDFRLFPLLGLREGVASLSGGSEAAPLARAASSDRAGSIELEQSFDSVELALGFEGYIPLSRWIYKPWLVAGARVGYVIESSHRRWEADGKGGFGALPGAPESSFFGLFMLGIGVEAP